MNVTRHSHPGKLIVFEGIDGTGKSTQVEMLVKYLNGRKIPVISTSTPGGSATGMKIREILFDSSRGPTTHKMVPDAASLLYLVSHLQTYQELIEPALQEGKIVISDRWDYFSGRAFATAGAYPVSRAVQDLRLQLAGPLPDMVFFLRGDPNTMLLRALTRQHQQGKKWSNPETLGRIQERYDELISEISVQTRVAYIGAGRSVEQVHSDIVYLLERALSSWVLES